MTPARVAGAERSAASLCEHLARAGHRVVVACKRGSPALDLFRETGLETLPLAVSGKLNPAAPFRIARLARECGAHVLHGQLSSGCWHSALAGRLTGLPSIAHVRALNTATWYRFSTRVIAVSRAVRDHLVAQGMDGSRVDVVYNGVDPDRYHLPCSRSDARARLGLPEAARIVGVVAHLSGRKGHPVLLEAAASLCGRFPDLLVLAVGEGDPAPLLAQAAALGIEGRVRFVGFQSDVLPYYAAMDLLALPSLRGEGLPRALLEAGLLGLPAVASAVSGVPEIVRDGETGFLVPPGDAAALAGRLEPLLEDAGLRDRMGAAAREFVAVTFTVRAMVEGTLACYGRAGVREGEG